MPLENWFHNLNEFSIQLAWCHWNRLGATGHGPKNHCTTDPESLLILSAMIGDKDLRLMEITGQWLQTYEALISIERLRNIVIALNPASDDISTLTTLCNILTENTPPPGLVRWKSFFIYLNKFVDKTPRYMEKGNRKLQTHDSIVRENIQLTLRYLLGSNSRSEILYYALVVTRQKRNPFNLIIATSQLAHYLHFHASSMYRTLKELEGGLILNDFPELKVGKSRVYTLSDRIRLFEDQEVLEKNKCFIWWLPLVQLTKEILLIRQSFEGIQDESLLKSRARRFAIISQDLFRRACIPVSTKLSYNEKLQDVSLESIIESNCRTIDEAYQFIISPEWPS